LKKLLPYIVNSKLKNKHYYYWKPENNIKFLIKKIITFIIIKHFWLVNLIQFSKNNDHINTIDPTPTGFVYKIR